MPRLREIKSTHQGHDFVHEYLRLDIDGRNEASHNTLRSMGLMPFFTRLTMETGMALVTSTKSTFDPIKELVLMMDPYGIQREVELVHSTLGLPNFGGVV